MPWHNKDLSKLTYETAGDLTWGDVKIMEGDRKYKDYIKKHFRLLFDRIEEDVDKGLFDPTIPIGDTSAYFFTLLEEEEDRTQDPYDTWQKCESKLIEEQTEDD